MTGIAITQTSRRQVEHTHEERDEHVGVVALTHRIIQTGDDTFRH